MSRKNECEWEAVEKADRRRVWFALGVAALFGIAFLLCGCAHGPIAPVSLSSAVATNATIKKHVATAQQDINQVLKDNAIIARPDLTLELQDANGQLIAANDTILEQASDLAGKQNQIDAAVAQGNKAEVDLAATVPKHKRDIYALVATWILCSLACIIGPLLFNAYPALVFFPT